MPTSPGRAAAFVCTAGLLACGAPEPAHDVTEPVLRLSLPYEPESFDPQRHKRLSDFAIASSFYEPLVFTDADGRLRPGLAERWENPDPLTWVFHIRPGVRFHSGRLLTATDVEYSLVRLRASSDLQLSSYLGDVTSIRALGPSSVEVKTRVPSGLLVTHLRFVMIVPCDSQPGPAARVDGTGPYRLDEWEPQDRLAMQRFEDYWGEKPAFRRVEMLLGRVPEQAVEEALSGRSQLACCATRTALPHVQSSADFRVVTRNSFFVIQLGFDLRRGVTPYASPASNPFLDRRVREALGLAVDRDELVGRLTSPAVPAFQPVPPSVFGHDTTLRERPPDPDTARVLLGQAGLGDGFDVTLHTRNQFREAAEVVRDQLGRVGVRVTVEALPDPEFFDLVERQEASLFISRWGQLTGDAGEMLESSVHTRTPDEHLGALNFGGYSNPDIDREIEDVRSVLDPARRGARLSAVVGRVTQDLVWIPLYNDQQAYVVSKDLAWQPRNDSLVLPAEIRRAK